MINKGGLEDFIKEHRAEFDFKMPTDQLWSRIDTALDQQKAKKNPNLRLWLGAAASLILVMTLLWMYTQRHHHRELQIADVNPGFAKKEVKFASMIAEKRDSLQIYAQGNPELYAKFSADLNKLGGDYEQLKRELQNSPNQKVVVKAMVKNLELQLQVISQQLSIINEVNQYREENKI